MLRSPMQSTLAQTCFSMVQGSVKQPLSDVYSGVFGGVVSCLSHLRSSNSAQMTSLHMRVAAPSCPTGIQTQAADRRRYDSKEW